MSNSNMVTGINLPAVRMSTGITGLTTGARTSMARYCGIAGCAQLGCTTCTINLIRATR